MTKRNRNIKYVDTENSLIVCIDDKDYSIKKDHINIDVIMEELKKEFSGMSAEDIEYLFHPVRNIYEGFIDNDYVVINKEGIYVNNNLSFGKDSPIFQWLTSYIHSFGTLETLLALLESKGLSQAYDIYQFLNKHGAQMVENGYIIFSKHLNTIIDTDPSALFTTHISNIRYSGMNLCLVDLEKCEKIG